MKIRILTEGAEQIVHVREGMTVLDALRQAGLTGIEAPCGGMGTCGKCRVTIRDERGENSVLACQEKVWTDMTILPGAAREHAVVLDGLYNSHVTPDSGLYGYGVACDIGTTTIACHLVDLSDGATIASAGEGSRQAAYGADVISRITAASNGLLQEMTDAVTGQLSDMMQTLAERADIPSERIVSAAIAGNTTMLHILSGLDPTCLGAAPFTPLSLFGDTIPARTLDLPMRGYVYLTPAVSAYVGGDITADVIACGMDEADSPILLIDVGTNGEMALGSKERIVCCATAAGPVFEGAELACGMSAGEGAIQAVFWEHDSLRISVIGGGQARGICGSGLIDAIAVMLDLGAVDETGLMLDAKEDVIPPELAGYLRLTKEGEPAFYLADDVFITQGDVRKIQLGKGAIRAGIEVLAKEEGGAAGRIGALLLAGGFGSFIRPESAARIGMIPEELLPVTKGVGNLAAEGARRALLSKKERERMKHLGETMEYIELSGLPAFSDAYMEHMMFPDKA